MRSNKEAKKIIEKRKNLIKKILELQGKHPYEIENAIFYEDKVCNNPVKLVTPEDSEDITICVKRYKALDDFDLKQVKKGDVLYLQDKEALELINSGLIEPIFDDMECIGSEIFNGIICYAFKRTYSPFLDTEGYITVKIDPSANRALIHYFIDRMLDIVNNYPEIINEKAKKKIRKETIDAIDVWQLKRLRYTFKEIAKQLKISEATVKKRYYRAYELIYRKKYNPAVYKKPEIKKEYLKNYCEICKIRDSCTELCPDVIAYVEQDTKYLREYLPEKHI